MENEPSERSIEVAENLLFCLVNYSTMALKDRKEDKRR
jgi:hypothetical protein